MAQDYYKILGVDKKASQDEIKAQYRKLVKQYHPDLHPNDPNAAAKFKEINEANEILSDPDKRAKYDYELENPYASQGGFSGFSGSGFEGFGDIFSDIFSGFAGGSARTQTKQKGDDIRLEIELSFLDAAIGCSKEVSYSRRESCSDCHGTGAKNGTSYSQCSKCGGTGQVQYTSGSGFFRTVTRRVCPDCNGTGKKIIEKCSKCSGKGYNKTTTTVKFDIPAGADTNSYILKRGMGQASTNGGESGDLYIIIKVLPHKLFTRKNYDLYINLPISYKTACLGGSVNVPGITDTFKLDIPEGTQSGRVFTVRGKGIKSRSASGNMYVTVFVEVPVKLNKKQKATIESMDKEIDMKQHSKINEFKTNVQSLYGVDPYKN